VRGRPLRLMGVLACLGAILAAGASSDPPVAPAAGTAVPGPGSTLVPTAAVVGAVAICPDLREDGERVRTRVSVGAVPPAEGTEDPAAQGPATVQSQPLSAQEAPRPVPLDRPGLVAGELRSDLDGDGLVVTATGGLAAGLQVEQLTRTAGGAGRGLGGLRCEAPRTEAWFVGGGTTVGSSARLLLANPDDTPALVDVTVWSDTGPVDPRPGRGLVVPARRRAAVPLDQLAPDRGLVALRVVAQRGRVAGALRLSRVDGATPLGGEWVPQTPPPATEVQLPGVPAGPGRRTLQVTNPGREDVAVRVVLTTGDGQLVPPGLEALPVPAGTSVAADLSEQVAGSPASVSVTSDAGPVLATVDVVDGDDGPVREVAFAGAALPLSGPALVADPTGGPAPGAAAAGVLLLSAPEGDAAVDLAAVPVVGADVPLPEPRRVELPGGRTLAVPLASFLPAGSSGRLAVEVRPVAGRGPVLAARYLREAAPGGPLTTLLALQGAEPQVPRPVVVRDPAVGAGG
jgi:hypothetical protein